MEYFLRAIRAALSGEVLQQMETLTEEQWTQLFSLAEEHKVLPLIYEAIYGLPAVRNAEFPVFAQVRQRVRHMVLTQTVKTEEFLRLNDYLRSKGITPLVVKGVICRQIYPMPDHRLSGDEDILIPEAQFEPCHAAFEELGLRADVEDAQRGETFEVGYRKKASPLYIELHKRLFAPDAEVFGDLNRFFAGVFDRAISEDIQGRSVCTLEYTDHLFYLICHAFKHFIHSGFGIRQVCDITMYANAYGERIDWLSVYRNCCEIHAEVFAAAVFEIGRKHLVFDPEKAAYPEYWKDLKVDETDMLADLLSAGIYGGATMSRKHSSKITLDAVAADRRGKRGTVSVIGSVFPPADYLIGRYPYLRRHPYLLPIAWADRILGYGKETKRSEHNNAAETMQIGSQRIELLRQYGVIR